MGRRNAVNTFIVILLGVSVAMVFLNLGVGYGTKVLLMEEFRRLERAHVEEHLQAVEDTLEEEIEALGKAVANEAYWDSAYAFMSDRNRSFAENDTVSLDDLDLDFFAYLDRTGTVLLARYNVDGTVIPSLPEDLEERLRANQSVWRHENAESHAGGLLSVSSDCFMLAARAILTSREEGPARGSLIFGRRINHTHTDTHEKMVSGFLSLEIKVLDADQGTQLIQKGAVLTELYEQVVELEKGLTDIFGEPVISLVVRTDRDILEQGKATIENFLLLIAIISLALDLVVTFALFKWSMYQRDSVLNQNRYKRLFDGAAVPVLEIDLHDLDTELKRLRAAGRDFRSCLGRDREHFWTLLKRCKVVGANKKALKMFEAGSVEDLRQDVSSLLSPTGYRAIIRALAALWSGKVFFSCETSLRSLGGRQFPVIISMPLPEAGLGTVMLNVVDVTRLKEAEEALRQVVNKKDLLLKEVNHRVSNNLTAILSMVHATKDRLMQSRRQEDFLLSIDALENKISSLFVVHRMLSRARWQPIPVSQLCENVVGTVLKGGCAGSFRIRVDHSDIMLPSVQAQHIAIIVGELATNAVKHCSQKTANLFIQTTFNKVDDELALLFRDNGPGYPAEEGGNCHDTQGLKMIREIVSRNMSGKVEMFNDSGANTRITFKF